MRIPHLGILLGLVGGAALTVLLLLTEGAGPPKGIQPNLKAPKPKGSSAVESGAIQGDSLTRSLHGEAEAPQAVASRTNSSDPRVSNRQKQLTKLVSRLVKKRIRIDQVLSDEQLGNLEDIVGKYQKEIDDHGYMLRERLSDIHASRVANGELEYYEHEDEVPTIGKQHGEYIVPTYRRLPNRSKLVKAISRIQIFDDEDLLRRHQALYAARSGLIAIVASEFGGRHDESR